MTRRHRPSQRGFTLVELMVSLVLFSLVIAGMLSIAVTMARAFREQQLTVSAEDASRQAMQLGLHQGNQLIERRRVSAAPVHEKLRDLLLP